MPLALGLFFVFCISLLGVSFGFIWNVRTAPRLPPGPRPLPILGNLLDWPATHGWLRFAEWSKRYGDLVHIQIFGIHIIIIGTVDIAQDLMNQSIYSDRPRLQMAGELMGFSPSMILSPYGEHWRAMRKLTNRFLGKSMSTLWPTIFSDSKLLLKIILESPDEHRSAIQFILGKNIIKNTYGINVENPTDEFISISRETHETIEHAVIPGSFLVDFFPILKYLPSWLPGAGFKHLARVAKARGRKMVEKPFETSKTVHMFDDANYAMVPSLLRELSAGNRDHPVMEFQLKWAAASLYGAGAETMGSAITTFIFMMATHPEIQEKAQRDIDNVTEGKRLPTNEDLKALPYIEAIVKETLRFCPPIPLGVAHRLTRDDIYKGYHLPKGSIVLANIWGINRDSRYYSDASEFLPERFTSDHIELDPSTSIFGFGRRACVGAQYAMGVLSMNMASILSVYSISTHDLNVKPPFSGGLISHVDPICCTFSPRTTLAEQLIRGI